MSTSMLLPARLSRIMERGPSSAFWLLEGYRSLTLEYKAVAFRPTFRP
jgi:hypothetical protein